jgi:hypothetical protein
LVEAQDHDVPSSPDERGFEVTDESEPDDEPHWLNVSSSDEPPWEGFDVDLTSDDDGDPDVAVHLTSDDDDDPDVAVVLTSDDDDDDL